MTDLTSELEAKVEIVLEMRGQPLMDGRLARVLEGVQSHGSLLAACRAGGVAYSRAWEAIAKAEGILGGKMLEARKGGRSRGGAHLTSLGKSVLERYLEAEVAVKEKSPSSKVGKVLPPDLAVMGSHDIGLEVLVEMVKEKHPKLDVEVAWLGSSGGLASLMMGEADVAGVHLLDPETGKYNKPFLPRYWLEDKTLVIRGYGRRVGLLHRRNAAVEGVGDLLTKGFSLVNRRVGSGCRVLLDHLLRQAAGTLGIDSLEVGRRVKGYGWEVSTHLEVARAVAEGKGDVGVAIQYAAELYGLAFTPLTWEQFDFVILKDRSAKDGVGAFTEALRSKRFRKAVGQLPGYRVESSIGEPIRGS